MAFWMETVKKQILLFCLQTSTSFHYNGSLYGGSSPAHWTRAGKDPQTKGGSSKKGISKMTATVFYSRGVHFVWHGSPMLEHKFAENGVFLSNGARESRTAIWGVKVKKNPRKGLDFTMILLGILRACSPSREIIGNDTLVKSNNSQNCPPEGNGVHFIFEVDSILLFSEESDGVDHFLKKGAQRANFGPFLVAHE